MYVHVLCTRLEIINELDSTLEETFAICITSFTVLVVIRLLRRNARERHARIFFRLEILGSVMLHT